MQLRRGASSQRGGCKDLQRWCSHGAASPCCEVNNSVGVRLDTARRLQLQRLRARARCGSGSRYRSTSWYRSRSRRSGWRSCRCRRWCCARTQRVCAGFVLRRRIGRANTEVLTVKSQVAVPLDARYPLALGEDGWSECAEDHVEPLIWIVLKQTHFKILRRCIICKQHGAPFDVEDAVRGAASHRGKDAACTPRETGAARRARRGTWVLPQGEDGVVIRQSSKIVGWRWETRCDEAAGFVCVHKIQAAIGADVHPDVGGAVQLEVKRQRDKRIA